MSDQVIHLETQDENARRTWARPARSAALVALGFLLAVLLIMGDSYLRERRLNPLTVGEIAVLKAQLVQNPADETIKNRIRELDMQIRQQHFYRRSIAQRGGYLLLGGIVVLLIAAKTSAALTAQPYLPDPNVSLRGTQPRMAALARRGIIAFGLLMGGVLIGFASMPRYRLPEFNMAQAGAGAVPAPVEQAPITPEQFARNWPAFRGPTGSGLVAAPGEYPTEWDGASGRNILWKTKTELPGHASPIVWEDNVFLVGAESTKREVYCYDANTGTLKWKQGVGASGSGGLEVDEAGAGYAPCTPATDGRRVYAIFPTGDLAAFDFAGKRIWAKNLGLPKNPYGHAASLAVHGEKLIVQLDQGNVLKEADSSIMAIDGRTGQTVWQTKRDMIVSWSTPIVASIAGKPVIIANGNPFLAAYDADSGKELWRVKCMNGEVAPSPIFAGGLVFAANERAYLVAVKPDGLGDVTKSHVLWQVEDFLPDIVSPLSDGKLVWLIMGSGLLTAWDVTNGKDVYEQDFAAEIKASPVLAGGRLYILEHTGVMHVAESGRKYTELARSPLGEECNASPAFANGKIYIRTAEHLYCIGAR